MPSQGTLSSGIWLLRASGAIEDVGHVLPLSFNSREELVLSFLDMSNFFFFLTFPCLEETQNILVEKREWEELELQN